MFTMITNFTSNNFQENGVSNDTTSDTYPVFSLPIAARFWLLVVFEVPSLLCTFVLLYHLFASRTLRKSLHHHVVVVLLIVGLFSQLIDIPFYLNFMRIGIVWPPTAASCLAWWFTATGISNITNIIMAWASIERHILVFHNRWLVTKRQRFFLHYCPLFSIIIYGFTYYMAILLAYSCENINAFDQEWCLYPCFYNDEQLAMYDTVVNSIIPTPVITIFSVTLIFRVVKKRQNLVRNLDWRKYRRMIIQLLSISALFLFFNLPMTSLVLAHACGLPDDAAGQFQFYAYYLYHFVSLTLPFVCFVSSPEIRKRIKQQISVGH